MTEIFYYGCEFLYTAVIVWGIFRLTEILSGGEDRVRWAGTARYLTIVLIAVTKVYNSSVSSGLFSNLLLWIFVTVVAMISRIIYKNKFGVDWLVGCVFWGLVSIGDFFIQTMAYKLIFEDRQTDYLLIVSTYRGIYLVIWAVLLIVLIKCWIPKASRMLRSLFGHRAVMWVINIILMCYLVYFQRIYLRHVSDGFIQRWWTFMLGVVLVAVAALVYMVGEREKNNNQLLQMKLEMLEEQYQQMLKERREKDILLHDTKNHLLTISGLAENGKCAEIMAYIQNMYHILKQRENHAVTNHPLLDLILDSKVTQAKEYGIQVRIDSDDLSGLCLSEMEICALFSNLLDNAIEANERVTDAGTRWIEIACKRHNEMLTVRTVNPTDRNIEDGTLPKTSKKDKMHHGFGLLSIQQVVEAYGGHMTYHAENGEFHITICLKAFD